MFACEGMLHQLDSRRFTEEWTREHFPSTPHISHPESAISADSAVLASPPPAFDYGSGVSPGYTADISWATQTSSSASNRVLDILCGPYLCFYTRMRGLVLG